MCVTTSGSGRGWELSIRGLVGDDSVWGWSGMSVCSFGTVVL